MSKVIEECPNAEIVNLSPVRWLQDPLAEYKLNTNINKYEKVAKSIKDLEVISNNDIGKHFNIAIKQDIGIYVCDNQALYSKYLSYKIDNSEINILKKILHNNKFTSLGSKLTDYKNQDYFLPIVGITHPERLNAFHLYTKDQYIIKGKNYKNKNLTLYTDSRSSKNHNFKGISFINKEELLAGYNYIKSKFILFCTKYACIGCGHGTPYNFIPWIESLKTSDTDNNYYDFYGLNEEDINTINSNMKIYNQFKN